VNPPLTNDRRLIARLSTVFIGLSFLRIDPPLSRQRDALSVTLGGIDGVGAEATVRADAKSRIRVCGSRPARPGASVISVPRRTFVQGVCGDDRVVSCHALPRRGSHGRGRARYHALTSAASIATSKPTPRPASPRRFPRRHSKAALAPREGVACRPRRQLLT